jgi:hypothetical protein
MNKIVSISFFVLIVALSCVRSEKTKYLKAVPQKDVVLNVGYNALRLNVGYYKNEDKSFFYTFHHVYTNYITLFNEHGKKIDSILIKDYNRQNNPVVWVNFLNKDTIQLITKHGINYFINNRGQLIKSFYFQDTLLNQYSLSPYFYRVKGNEYLTLTGYNNNDNPYDIKSYCKHIHYFNKKNYSMKQLLFVKDIFSDTLSYVQELSDFEYLMCDANYYCDVRHVYVLYPKLYLYSDFSDKIFEYSIIKHKITKLIRIESNYTDSLYTHPIEMTGDCFRKMGALNNTGANGLVEEMFYSKKMNRYYVSIRIPLNETKDNERLRYAFEIYDNNFQKIGETPLFESSGILWTNSGIYVSVPVEQKEGDFYVTKLIYKYYEFI